MAKKRVRKVKRSVSRRSSRVSLRSSSRNPPMAIKIISIIFYIFAAFSIAGGILIMLGGAAGSAILATLGVDKVMSLVPGASIETIILGAGLLTVLIFVGILSILLGILEIFLGRGLWKRQKWAYIITVIFIILEFLKALFGILITPASIVGLIIYGVLGYYLIFNHRVKDYFR